MLTQEQIRQRMYEMEQRRQAMFAQAMQTPRSNHHRHPDRTAQHPIRWRCVNPECQELGQQFEFESDRARCPKCGGEDRCVVMLTLLHLVVRDDKGPIRGRLFNYRLACDKTRRRGAIATETNNEGATGDINSVNCAACLAEVQRLDLATPAGSGIQFVKQS